MADQNSVDPGNLFVSCDHQDRIIGAVGRMSPQLPKELREQFNDIMGSMMQHIGAEGMFICLNGKTVSAIIAQYGHVFKRTPITSGERDGVRFKLYEAPKKKIAIDEFGRPLSGWEEAS